MADTTPGPAEGITPPAPIEVPSLDPVQEAPYASPVNIQAQKVLADLDTMVANGQLSLVFVVGVGPGGSFSRNIGGSGNAYELAGLVELQKKELLDAIPAPTPQAEVQPGPVIIPDDAA
jgi:hypothetical protein